MRSPLLTDTAWVGVKSCGCAVFAVLNLPELRYRAKEEQEAGLAMELRSRADAHLTVCRCRGPKRRKRGRRQ